MTTADANHPGAGDLPMIEGSRPHARYAQVALILMGFANVFNYFDRLLVTVVAQPLKRYFILSDTQLGLLTGPAFVLVYVASTLVFGSIADRYSRRVIIAAVLAVWSAFTTMSAFAQSFVQLAIARAGVGIGQGGSNPASLSVLSDFFPPQRRAHAIAVFQASGMAGVFLAFLSGGWIAEKFGWRSVFLVAGIPGMVLAVLFLLFVREPERSGVPKHSTASLRETLIVLKGNPAYRWIVLASSLSVMGNLGALQWLPLFFIRSHGMSLKQIGLFFGPAVACGMAGGMLIGGWIGDRLGARSPARQLLLCIWATLAITPLYWFVLWIPSVKVALIVTFFATAASVVYAPSMTAVMLTVCDPRVRGMASAIFNFANGILGQAFFPVIVGVLSDAFVLSKGTDSLRYALTIVLIVCLIASACFVKALRVTSRALAGEVS